MDNDATLDPWRSTADHVARAFGTDLRRGLTSAEALRRQARDGPNTLRPAARQPAWRRLLAQFQDPLVYLLLAAVALTLVVWGIEGERGWPVDSIVISVIVLLNGLLGFAQETKARDAAAALGSLCAATASVLRDGDVKRVASADLVRGDLLVLCEGDAVGADARLVHATSLRVQEASLTGESETVTKDALPLPATTSLGDRRNMVFSGTAIVQGVGHAVVTAIGMATEIGAIAAMLQDTVEEPTPLEKEVGHIGRMLGVAIAVIAVVVVTAVLAMSTIHGIADVIPVLLLGVSLAVAAVPEGLPAILSVVLGLGVQRMAKHHAIVKKLSSVETLGCASVIASDKTGTLTQAQMTIERMITASGETRLTGIGYAPHGQVEHAGTALATGPLHAENIVMLSGGSLAGNAVLRQGAGDVWEIQGDPTEAAFLVAERKLGVTGRRERRFERVRDLPFTSERKIMSTIALDHEHGGTPVVITKGAPDVLLGKCTRVRVGLDTAPLDATRRARILADIDTLSDAALRTLAVAYRPLAPDEERAGPESLERDLVFVGTVGMIDPPRAEAASAIRAAHRAGIRIIMITGDHPRTAGRIAADLGIAKASGPVLTGLALDALDGAAFADAVRTTSVYARVSPAHKLRIVAALRAQGEVVAMTGDGVNDAPALKAADIGIAMGVSGTQVTIDAADMILADDNFATIVEAVREGRGILDNIRKALRYLLVSNMGEVLTVFLGVVGARVIGLTGPDGATVLPILATQLLWINLVTDCSPALALGVDPPTDDLMARKPRRLRERVIDARMWITVVESGLIIALATLLTIDMQLPGGMVDGTHDLVTARTAGFTVLVFTSMFTCLTARSATASAFAHLLANRWLWAANAVSVLLQVAVVNLRFLNLAFGTAPMTLREWLLCAAMASAVLWFSELRKLADRAWGAPRSTRRVPA